MPNITRNAQGQGMTGLMVYLAGAGNHNEHTEPHVVAGSASIMAWHAEEELNHDAAIAIAKELEHPRKVFGTEVPRGHVWHCSLSLKAEEGVLTDEKWNAIVEDYMVEMGFIAEGKAPVRYVAVRHGLSQQGNDHVHIAVNMVREDGTRASDWNDRPRAQRACTALEHRHGLQVLESRARGTGVPGVKPAERARAERLGLPEPERHSLARAVRVHATAAVDEADFVRRMRAGRLLVRPRWAAGRDDVVSGYSVAAKPRSGERPLWFGGGHLGKDLTLPRLREAWPDTPEGAAAAVVEWTRGARNRPTGKPWTPQEPTPEVWQAAAGRMGELRDWLRSVPVEDFATWGRVASEVSGAFAAWSSTVEGDTPGPIAAAADQLAGTAQLSAWEAGDWNRSRPPAARGAALLLASAAHGGQGQVGRAVLLRQLMNTAKAIHDAHLAAGEARTAAAIEARVRGRLQALVTADLPPTPTLDRALPEAHRGPEQDPARPVGSPLPSHLERARAPRAPRGGGMER